MSFAEAICAKCEEKNSVTVCVNCDSDKLVVSKNKESKKIDKIDCEKCTHSFSKIKCTRCKAEIYLRTATTKKPSFWEILFGSNEKIPATEAETNLYIWVVLILLAAIIYLMT